MAPAVGYGRESGGGRDARRDACCFVFSLFDMINNIGNTLLSVNAHCVHLKWLETIGWDGHL